VIFEFLKLKGYLQLGLHLEFLERDTRLYLRNNFQGREEEVGMRHPKMYKRR
jgi:hypothetical protein